MSSIKLAAAAVAAAVLLAACSSGPHASSSSGAASAPAASAATTVPAAHAATSAPAAHAATGAPAAGGSAAAGRLTMKQAELAYGRIVGPGSVMANKLAVAASGTAPFSQFRTDALTYATELRAEIGKFRAVRWPTRAQSRINSMVKTEFPADIGCLQAMAAAGSTSASQAVGDSNHDCMVADNSTIPGTLQSMLSQ